MHLQYDASGSVTAHLDEGDTLHTTAGPCVLVFPAEAGSPYYEAALATGLPIAPYDPPPPVVPVKVQRHQALIVLYQTASITETMIEAAIAQIEDEGDRYITSVRYRQPEWYRDSEFIPKLQPAFGLSDLQVDQLFIAAASA